VGALRAGVLGAWISGLSGLAGEVAPFQDWVSWQLLQSCVVTGCVACLPVAVMPLWHDIQVALRPLWLNRAGSQARVPWQALQSWLESRWRAGLPGAVAPLWQEVQLAVTPWWSNRAGSHAVTV
jgi:hypothetical protein